LGVDVGHIINHEPIFKTDNEGIRHKTDMTIEVTTGMMIVAPAWKLEELLNDKYLSDERKRGDDKWVAEKTNQYTNAGLHQCGVGPTQRIDRLRQRF
jgi:hypothetical protein